MYKIYFYIRDMWYELDQSMDRNSEVLKCSVIETLMALIKVILLKQKVDFDEMQTLLLIIVVD